MKCGHFDRAKPIKNPVSFLYRNRGGLDLSKEALWVSVGQKTAKLQAVRFKDLKKSCCLGQSRTKRGQHGFESWTSRSSSKFDRPQQRPNNFTILYYSSCKETRREAVGISYHMTFPFQKGFCQNSVSICTINYQIFF